MAAGHVVLVTLTILCMFLGLGAVIGGAVGDSWYVNPVLKLGLWKRCVPTFQCFKRTNLFKFYGDGVEFDFDVILATLCASATLCFIATFSTLFMFCCQRSPGAWRCCALLVAIVSMLGALCALGAVGYNEYIGQTLYKGVFDHGWSNIIVWVSGGLQLFGSVFAYILICVAPNRVTEGVVFQQQQYNNGYELR